MAFFRAEAEQGGVGDSGRLARQLMVVFAGARARAGIGADKPTGLVVPVAAVLLDAACVRWRIAFRAAWADGCALRWSVDKRLSQSNGRKAQGSGRTGSTRCEESGAGRRVCRVADDGRAPVQGCRVSGCPGCLAPASVLADHDGRLPCSGSWGRRGATA
jgi:ribosomal protein S27AE